jgi:hypothetical protein
VTSTTEYRLSRRRARTQDGEGGGEELREPTEPEVLASGSQRLDTRVPMPAVDGWSTFEADTAEIDLPEVAMPALNRVSTEPMPLTEIEDAIAAKDVMDNAATLSGFAGGSDAAIGVTIDPMPVRAIAFGEHQILIVQRTDAVELILPGGQRLIAPRDAAAALAEALVS